MELKAVKAELLKEGSFIFKPQYSCEGCIGLTYSTCQKVSKQADKQRLIPCKRGYIYKEVV